MRGLFFSSIRCTIIGVLPLVILLSTLIAGDLNKTIIFEANFGDLSLGEIDQEALNQVALGGSWKLNLTRGAAFSIVGDDSSHALLFDDTQGNNNATIDFATVRLEEALDFSNTAISWEFRTATRRTGSGKALRFDFFNGTSVVATFEWRNDGIITLNSVNGESAFTFLFPWNPVSDAVREVRVVLFGDFVTIYVNGNSLFAFKNGGHALVEGMRIYSSGNNEPNSQGRGLYLEDLRVTKLTNPSESPVRFHSIQLQSDENILEVGLQGAPLTLYRFFSVFDLNFEAPGRTAFLPLNANRGSMVLTNAKGEAMVEFSVIQSPKLFFRAESMGPVRRENNIPINVGNVLTNVKEGPGGFVTCWLLDSDIHRPRSTSMVDVYQQIGARSVRFPFGHLSNNYLWTSPPYEDAINGLTHRVATMQRAPASFTWAVNPDGSFKNSLDFDEFIDQCRQAGIEPVVVINVLAHKYPGGPTLAELKEAAVEWVRYANVIRDYNVKYWQLGNEQDHHSHLLSRNEYMDIYDDFTTAMRAVDPSIRTGIALIGNRIWARELLAAFPERIDFVGSHQYQWNDWSLADWLELTEPLVPNQIQIVEEIKNSARPDAELFVTEFNASGRWEDGPGLPDMMRILTIAEMLLHMITLENFTYAHYWTTHSPWAGEFAEPGLQSALGLDNELMPSAEVISLINNNIGNQMVQAQRVSGMVRTFVSFCDVTEAVTVFLINKGNQPAAVELVFNGFTPESVIKREVFQGNSYFDQTPYQFSDYSAEFDHEAVSTILPGISFTVLRLSGSDS